MEEPRQQNKRTDHFQRVLITFFYREHLTPKERKIVILIVRLLSSVFVLVVAMLVTIITESIENFIWVILWFLSGFFVWKMLGCLWKVLDRKKSTK
jgi:Na+/proline symporter